MEFKGMDDFQHACRNCLCNWYANNQNCMIFYNDTYVVWSCKTLQNMKCLCSTSVSGDGIYAEFTYNGDKKELYVDVYKKQENICFK